MQDVLIRTAEKQDLSVVRKLAEEIWPVTYGSILPEGQVRYMLDKIYNPAALQQQITGLGHQFLILECNGKPSGYASFSCSAGRARLHKFYVLPSLQGKGLGRLLMAEVVHRAKKVGASILTLDVNRENKARYFYEKIGFSVTGEKNTDIGEGFYMNDFVMECSLTLLR